MPCFKAATQSTRLTAKGTLPQQSVMSHLAKENPFFLEAEPMHPCQECSRRLSTENVWAQLPKRTLCPFSYHMLFVATLSLLCAFVSVCEFRFIDPATICLQLPLSQCCPVSGTPLWLRLKDFASQYVYNDLTGSCAG